MLSSEKPQVDRATLVERASAIDSLGHSLKTLAFHAARDGQDDLGLALHLGSHLASVGASVAMLQLASVVAENASSLAYFSSSLGLVATGVSLLMSADSEASGLGDAFEELGSLIIQGFQHVFLALHTIRLEMHDRFDRLEVMMDKEGYKRELGFLEVLHEHKNLKAMLATLRSEVCHKATDCQLRLDRMSHSLATGFMLMHSNLAAFRQEGMYKLLTRIRYMESNGLLTRDKRHEMIADLEATWTTIAASPHVTHYSHVSKPLPAVYAAMKDECPENLCGLLTGMPVAHPVICKVTRDFIQTLVDGLPKGERTEYHKELLSAIDLKIAELRDGLTALGDQLPAHLEYSSSVSPCLVEDGLSEYKARAIFEQRSDRDTALAHLRKVLTHHHFEFYKEEMCRMNKNQGGQIESGSSAASVCPHSKSFVKMVFEDGHHCYRCGCPTRGQFDATGLICGSIGSAWVSHPVDCARRIGEPFQYALHGPHVEGGLSDTKVKDFLSHNHSVDFVSTMIKQKLEEWLDNAPTPTHVGAEIRVKDQLFFLPWFLDASDKLEMLLEHGYLPKIILDFNAGAGGKGVLRIEDPSAKDLHQRLVWESPPVPFATHQPRHDVLTPLETFLCFFLGGLRQERFGIVWKIWRYGFGDFHGKPATLQDPLVYTLPLGIDKPLFESSCLAVWQTLDDDVFESLVHRRTTALEREHQTTLQGQEHQMVQELPLLFQTKKNALCEALKALVE